MTPDIREKAERLLADIRANDRQPHTMTSSVDLISQALLEAHKAVCEDAAKLIEEGYERKVARPYRDDGVRSKNDQCEHGRYMYEDCEACAVIAIRSIT